MISVSEATLIFTGIILIFLYFIIDDLTGISNLLLDVIWELKEIKKELQRINKKKKGRW